MSDPLPPDEPTLSAYMRVVRGNDTLQHLIDAFPDLERKALSSPSTLTDFERRQLLDLPNAEDEAANIAQASPRSRNELLSAALSNPAVLADNELALLERRFWSPRTMQEAATIRQFLLKKNQAIADRIYHTWDVTQQSSENQAFRQAAIELRRRKQQVRDEEQSRYHIANLNPPPIPPWMEHLAQRFRAEKEKGLVTKEEKEKEINTWGFVALIDAEAPAISADRWDSFCKRFQGLHQVAMKGNGAYSKLLNRTWKLFLFNGPADASVSLDPDADHSEFRNAFATLVNLLNLDDTGPCSAAQGGDARTPVEVLRKRRGFLTNTFLVINKTCVDSVLDHRSWDEMRILAFEADFPQPGRAYVEGYRGWTWVRFEQLVYRFYGARMNEKPGMDEIWKAAQGSIHGGFAAMDPEVAKIHTRFDGMVGGGKRFYGIE